MTVSDTLESALEGEDIVAQVPLGGDDLLAVTPSRTLVYRADGLLSDETVEELPHDAEQLDVSDGRRKATISVDYGLDGERTLKLPSKRLDDALHPMLAGILSASGVTDPGETVLRTFRFSELTLVITDERLVKHIGSATWADEHEEFTFEAVTNLDFEEGTVATSIVLTVGGRQERFKAPNEQARAVRETLTEALCEYHDVGSLEEFRITAGPDDAEESDADPADFGAGPDPLSTSGVEGDEGVESIEAAAADGRTDGEATDRSAGTAARRDATATVPDGTTSDSASGSPTGARGGESQARADDPSTRVAETASDEATATGEQSGTDPGAAFEDSGFEPAGVDEGDLAEEVAELRAIVEAQTERLERQNELVERLVEELRRGR